MKPIVFPSAARRRETPPNAAAAPATPLKKPRRVAFIPLLPLVNHAAGAVTQIAN
jgi:hypothetical protein